MVLGSVILAVAAFFKIEVETAQQFAFVTLPLMFGATVVTLWNL